MHQILASQQQQLLYNGPKKIFNANQSLYVGNLTPNTFDNDLYKHFQAKGYKIASAKVMIDK